MRARVIATAAAGGILGHLVARYGFGLSPEMSEWPLVAVLLFGGAPLVWGLLLRVVRGEFGSDLLAGMSIVVSAILGQYLAGAIVVLMLSGGTALEQYATRRASSVLGALAKRMPSRAHRITPDGMTDIDLAGVHIGEQLAVFPHEICPVDGTVVEGQGTMDESYLTGEPFRIAKAPGSEALSGAVNGESALKIEVTRLPVDSRYAKIMRVMQEAESNRPRMRRLADRLGGWYTVLGIAMAAVGAIAGHDASRFLAVLVIATPCPLLLAIPVAIISAISLAASRGIVVKDPALLERIRSCRTFIFDKTGTLTHGRPALTEVVCAKGGSRAEALRLAASLEQYSKHPLAGSVLDAARRERVELAPASEILEAPGRGLMGRIGAMFVEITGRKAVLARGENPDLIPPAASGMECVLLADGQFMALFRFHDAPRKESRPFVLHLRPHHSVNKLILLSGDREEEVRYLAKEVGIDLALFGKSPEEKVEIVRKEAAIAPTLFIGDGINDAPAMQAATAGIAFGQNSDITAEAAGAVVLEASLSKVDELMHIGRRMRAIALQSALGGMGLSMVGMVLAAAGLLAPVAGAIAQEAIDAAAVLNALRMALPAKTIRDEGI